MGNPYAPPEKPSADHQDAPVGPPDRADHVHPPLAPPPTAGPVPPREPDVEGVARAHRWATGAAAALLVSVLLLSSPYPWTLGATPAALLALACAVVAVVHAGRAHARASLLVTATVLVVGALGWSAVSAQSLVFAPALRTHAQCQARAITEQAARTCDAQLQDDLNELTRSMLPTVPQD